MIIGTGVVRHWVLVVERSSGPQMEVQFYDWDEGVSVFKQAAADPDVKEAGLYPEYARGRRGSATYHFTAKERATP